jgi:MFS family permease
VLLFAQHGWGQAWLAFTVLSIAFMAGRLIFRHLPDRIGGARFALVSVLIEAAGQALIWLAPWSTMALFGAAITGLGVRLYEIRRLASRCPSRESLLLVHFSIALIEEIIAL